jgi:hypothetical protein
MVTIDVNTDATVQLTATAHLRLYAVIGVQKSSDPTADANAMASFATSFVQRYGPGGSFWAQHPELPYLPVESYEIGNEPNQPPSNSNDGSWLRYGSPAGYALVYEAARTALHAVDPAATVVVGGMLDSGALPLAGTESYLAAIGPMDAVGFHPYRYDLTAMEQDTQALRQWLDANGHRGVPLDINEFGAADGVTPGIATWGPEAASFTQWALCTPGLGAEDVQPFYWGAIPSADTFPWYSMFTSELTITPLGSAYLGETSTLTSQGCPALPAAPVSHTHPAKPRRSIGTAVSVHCRAAVRRTRTPHGARGVPAHRRDRCDRRTPSRRPRLVN